MAKYTVAYACGHEGTVELFGKHDERERKLAWYREVALCPDCYRKQQRAKVAEATVAEGLVELVGSEAQAAWANELRLKLLKDLRERYPKRDETHERLFALLREVMNELPEAKWWIDNRDNLLQAISPAWKAKVREAGLI